MSNPKENDKDKMNQSNEETKEQLLRELSENLNIGQEEKNNNKKEVESKITTETMPDTIEISCIEPSNLQKEKFFKNNNDNTIINVFGDDDDNLVSFYGEGGDLEKLVKTLDINKNNNEAEGYLTAFNITKVENEHLAKFTQSIGQKELLACKKVIDKVEFDGKMVTKVNEIATIKIRIGNSFCLPLINFSLQLFIILRKSSHLRKIQAGYCSNILLSTIYVVFFLFTDIMKIRIINV